MNDIIGRQAETTRIAELVGRLPTAGGAVVLSGEAGIGKSVIAATATDRAVARGATLMQVTATESEASVPYAALQELMHPCAGRIEAMRERPRSILARAFGLERGEAPDVFAVAVATLEVLTDVGADRGVLLLVDDAHWVDDSTAHVLSFIARRIASDPVVAVFAIRSGHPSPLIAAGIDTLELARLTPVAARELVRVRRCGLSVDAEQRILRCAEGNPLALLELPDSFDHEADDQTLNGRLHAAFLARFDGMSVVAATLLLLAAIDDGDEVEELSAAASHQGIEPSETAIALGELVEAGALLLTGARFAFRHPLIRSAVVSSATPQRRRDAHAALYRAITDQLDRAVWHRAAAVDGADEATATALEDLARRAAQQGNLPVSLRAWERSARATPTESDRFVRLLHGAEAAIELGRADRASVLMAQVRIEHLSRQGAARFALLQSEVDPRALGPEGIRRLLRHGHDALDAGDVDLAIALTLSAGEHLDAAGYESEAAATELSRRTADALDDDDPRRLVVLAALDPVPYTEQITAAVLALDPAELNERSELLVRVRFMVDANAGLARMQSRLLEGYRSHGQLRSIALLQPVYAWNQIALANWPEALRGAEEGTRLAADLNLPRWGTGTLIAEAYVAAIRGDHLEAERLILESERGAVLAGANNVLTGIQLTKGVNHLAQARYDDAFGAFRRSANPTDPSYHALQSGWMLGDLAEAAAHSGHLDEIRHLYLRDHAKPTTPWRAMAEQYALPFLASGDDEVEHAFESALGGVVKMWPSYRARLLLEYGSWLRRQRRIGEAREQLRAGKELADALAMGPWSARARAELRAAGEDSASRHPAAWESLSAQELQVMHLAATGLSNREIGERLFLSHRTVGSHLYRIFPKLGVTNRAQLAGVLGAEATRPLRPPLEQPLAPRSS